jgi:hypothetical protein
MIGAFEATYNRLSSDHLPIFADTLGRGLSRLADLSGTTNTFQYLLGVQDQESRARWEGTLEAGLHGLRANYAHSLSGVLDNLGAIPEGKGFGDPLEGLAAPVRQFYEEQSRAREELSREHGLRQQIASGAIEAMGLLPEYLAVAAALPAIGLPALAALPVIMANRASRDPISGEFTGFGATARGAATGAAMHGVFAGASKLSTMPRRMGAAGGGMAAITAYEDGSQQDVAASFFLGAGMAGLGGKRKGAQRDLKREGDRREFDWSYIMEREYARQGESHALLDGLKQAERRMAMPQEAPENGVPRSYIDFEPRMAEPRPYEARGPRIPDEGYPATAIPGYAVTQWQAQLVTDAMQRGTHRTMWKHGKGKKSLNVDGLLPYGEQREAAEAPRRSTPRHAGLSAGTRPSKERSRGSRTWQVNPRSRRSRGP